MNIILSLKGSLKTIGAVQDEIQEECILFYKSSNGQWFKRNQDEETIRCTCPEITKRDQVINWGNYIFLDQTFGNKVLNKPSSIKNTSNKMVSRKLLQGNRVRVPRTWFRIEDIPFGTNFLARPDHHFKGSDFFLVQSMKDFKMFMDKFYSSSESWYFSEIFDKTNEYRVHVFKDKVLAVAEKEIGEKIQDVNRKWSYLRFNEFNETICKEAIKASNLLELDYSAVDIIYNSDNHTFVITELNTAPELSPYTITKHAKAFDWWFQNSNKNCKGYIWTIFNV